MTEPDVVPAQSKPSTEKLDKSNEDAALTVNSWAALHPVCQLGPPPLDSRYLDRDP